MAISIKDAGIKAIQFFEELYPDKYVNLILEEFDLSEDGQYWLITLGYGIPGTRALTRIQEAMGGTTEIRREYKVFAVNRKNGGIHSMKLKKL